MIRDAIGGWRRFWFEPQSTATLAVVRIAFGLLMTLWTLSLAPSLFDFFTRDGILPESRSFREGQSGWWSVFDLFGSDTAVVIGWALLLIASVCLMLGLFTRVAAVVVFVLLLSFERRNAWVFHAGDTLLRIIAFYLCFAPAGAALSLDRLRTARERFWEFPLRAPIVIRLLQIQVSIIYISTVWAKVRGKTWNDGTAVVYSLNLDDLARFPVPAFVLDSELLANLVTWGVLAGELAIGILVWVPRLRPWVLGIGVALHLGIDIGLRVAFFSWTVFVLYVAFLPPRRVEAFILAVRERVATRGLRRGLAPRELWAVARGTASA